MIVSLGAIMQEALETVRLLFATFWNFICLSCKLYMQGVEALGKPWTMMIHSTVFGTIGGLIVNWFLGIKGMPLMF
jgi:hypothetical protein